VHLVDENIAARKLSRGRPSIARFLLKVASPSFFTWKTTVREIGDVGSSVSSMCETLARISSIGRLFFWSCGIKLLLLARMCALSESITGRLAFTGHTQKHVLLAFKNSRPTPKL
jgi:hypothetical protein